jgi:hypothetical protein
VLHDIIILAVLAVASLLSALVYHETIRSDFSKGKISKAEWWYDEGMMIVFVAFVALLLLALAAHVFHTLH